MGHDDGEQRRARWWASRSQLVRDCAEDGRKHDGKAGVTGGMAERRPALRFPIRGSYGC